MRTKIKYAAHVREWRAQQPLDVRRRGMLRDSTFRGLMHARDHAAIAQLLDWRALSSLPAQHGAPPMRGVYIRLPDGRRLAARDTLDIATTLMLSGGGEARVHPELRGAGSFDDEEP